MKFREAIIVEGIYDKMKLEQFLDAVIIPVNGFALFQDRIMKMIRKLAQKRYYYPYGFRQGRILIRRYVQSCIREQILHAYTGNPAKKRESACGEEGLLGVEGVSGVILQAEECRMQVC